MANIRKNEVSGVALLLFVISFVIGIAVSQAVHHPSPAIFGALVGVYFLFAIKVVRQWEKVAVLRLGRYVGLRGPGLCHIVPIVETLSPYVDQRVRVASVSAESTLTRDTVPVNVDAIVFWLVWNAEKSILEVENFIEAITMSAQTALRESIGRHELAQMITERETMGRELQRILDDDEKLTDAPGTPTLVGSIFATGCGTYYHALYTAGSAVERGTFDWRCRRRICLKRHLYFLDWMAACEF